MRISKELKRITIGYQTFTLEEVKESKKPIEYWATISTKKDGKTFNRVKNLRTDKYEVLFNDILESGYAKINNKILNTSQFGRSLGNHFDFRRTQIISIKETDPRGIIENYAFATAIETIDGKRTVIAIEMWDFLRGVHMLSGGEKWELPKN